MRPCLDDQSLNRLLLLSAPAAFFSYALGHCMLCAGVYIDAEREASSDALCTVASLLSTLAGLDKKQGRDDDVLFCRAKREGDVARQFAVCLAKAPTEFEQGLPLPDQKLAGKHTLASLPPMPPTKQANGARVSSSNP